MNVVDDTDPLVAEMVRIIVKLEIMLSPDATAFQTHRRDLRLYNGVAGFEFGIGTLYKFELVRLRDRQDDVTLAQNIPLFAGRGRGLAVAKREYGL